MKARQKTHELHQVPAEKLANQNSTRPAVMQWSPAVPPPLTTAYGGRRINKKRAGLPRLLHRLFIKVLRLHRPSEEALEAACYGYRTGSDEEYCYYYYSCGGAGSSWAGVLSSIPEEEADDDSSDSAEESTPDVVVPAALRKSRTSERFVVGPTEAAAAVVHVEVLL